MWEIDIKLQLLGFLRAVALGAVFCVFYDFFRALRKHTSSSTFEVLLEDILYFAVCAPVIFCFLLATTNGEIRFFVFLGIILGFITVRLTISKAIVKALAFLIELIIKFYSLIRKGFEVFCKFISRIYASFLKLYNKIFEKAQKVVKKLLKKQ